MIHVKLINVLLFLLLASLWFLAYFYTQVLMDMQNYNSKQEIKAIKQEFMEWKVKQQDDLPPPELEPEPINPQDYLNETPLDIPGIYVDPRIKVLKHGNSKRI